MLSENTAVGAWVTVYHGNSSEEPTVKRISGLCLWFCVLFFFSFKNLNILKCLFVTDIPNALF